VETWGAGTDAQKQNIPVFQRDKNVALKEVKARLYRVAKAYTMHYLYRSFSANEPYKSWLFGGKQPAT